MSKILFIKGVKSTALLLLMSLSISCVSNKKIPYFQDIQDVDNAKLDNSTSFVDPVIQTDDILSINIFTLSPESNDIINQAANTPVLGTSANTNVSSQQISGFLVDKHGEIELSLVGKIKVAGLTTFEASNLVRSKVSVFFKDPNVQLRFANFKVSVLGEVNRPSTYILPNEKVSIFDAISLAGDLTIYGKRDNVLIVRDNNGRKEFARLNLNSSNIFNNPFYYLRQNDVVYVEPNKARVSTNNAAQVQAIGIVTSIVSILILAVSAL